MRHLPSAELQLNPHFETVCEKVLSVSHLDRIVVRINIDSELHFLLSLLRLVGLLLLRLLVFVFAEVDNTTHRWPGMGSNLHQIETELLGLSQGLVSRQHNVVLTIDYTDFGGPNPIIHPRPWCTRPTFHGSLSDSVFPPMDVC